MRQKLVDAEQTHGEPCNRQLLEANENLVIAALQDTVSRHGGDEFLVLLDDVLQTSDAEHIAQKILYVLSTPYKAGEHTFHLSVSLGIAMYPEDGKDAAMCCSKKRGPGSFAFHMAGDQD